MSDKIEQDLSNARFREITCHALDRMNMPSIGHVMVKMARLEAENERARALRSSLLALMAEDDGTYEWCVRMAARVGTLLGEAP